MAGRKSLKDELKVMERYADLSEPYFKVLKKALKSESKEDQRWAADNLKGAFAKMIPTEIKNDPDNPINFGVVMLPTKQIAGEDSLEATTETSGGTE